MDIKNNILEIIKHYGIDNQIKKFNEESFELIESLVKYNVNEDCKGHVIEELGDCYLLLEQFKLYLNITNEDLEYTINHKTLRQLHRMEVEKNE